jgi:hypothetical protein
MSAIFEISSRATVSYPFCYSTSNIFLNSIIHFLEVLSAIFSDSAISMTRRVCGDALGWGVEAVAARGVALVLTR